MRENCDILKWPLRPFRGVINTAWALETSYTHTYNTQFSEVTKPFVQWQYKAEKSLSTLQPSRNSSNTLLKPLNV